MEIHHIVLKSEGGGDTYENAIPLCFDCHADQTSYDKKHPKGSKYTSAELKLHRDHWYARILSTSNTGQTENYKIQDASTLEELKEALPWDNSISFIQRHNFGSPFNRIQIQNLDDFIDFASNPEREFLDPDLESLRGNLRGACADFLEALAIKTFPVQQVPFYVGIPQEWELTGPGSRAKAAIELNQLAAKVVIAYSDLIKQARLRLL